MKSVFLFSLFVSVSCYCQRSDFSHIDFKKADSIALTQKGAGLQNLPVLTHNLTATLATDVEKFRAIYTWVSTNIENDYSSYLKTSRKRKKLSDNREALLQWNRSYSPKVFKKLLTEKKTACTGYAYLIHELTSLAQINCKTIDGYGRTATLKLDTNSLPNHSWNAVELHGKWYLCDATWSAGHIVIEEDQPIFKSNYFDGYFLADPALFIKNHYPLDLDLAFVTKPISFSEFIKGPVVYKEAFKTNSILVAPLEMHLEVVKNVAVLFSLKVPENFKNDSISLLLDNGRSSNSIQPKTVLKQNMYHFKHVFNRTGTYDVHIQVNDTIIATYVIRVKRK